jgi:hypothetical protein
MSSRIPLDLSSAWMSLTARTAVRSIWVMDSTLITNARTGEPAVSTSTRTRDLK